MIFQHVVNVAASWLSFEEFKQTHQNPEVELQAEITELKNSLKVRDLALAKAEKQCARYKELSRLAQDTLETNLASGTKMTKDLDPLHNELATSRANLGTSQSERAKLEAELNSALSREKKALSEKEKAMAERDQAYPRRVQH